MHLINHDAKRVHLKKQIVIASISKMFNNLCAFFIQNDFYIWYFKNSKCSKIIIAILLSFNKTYLVALEIMAVNGKYHNRSTRTSNLPCNHLFSYSQVVRCGF
ncbi:hypothetical protein BN1088_1580006 [Sphingobacterium sp. PM2-P1-29]|nr:hypothetical protein BN1088_1580006 [Sphingobacterium sp. PM2-P1-29]